jgi:hypothetical protein
MIVLPVGGSFPLDFLSTSVKGPWFFSRRKAAWDTGAAVAVAWLPLLSVVATVSVTHQSSQTNLRTFLLPASLVST